MHDNAAIPATILGGESVTVSREPSQSSMKLNQPFAGAIQALRRDALSQPEYDPAQLFAWGQMMAVSVLEMLKAVEARFGREGQQTCTDTLVEVGRRLALEGLDGVEVPDDTSPIEAISRFATWVNEQLYASIEKPSIDGPDADTYQAMRPGADFARLLGPIAKKLRKAFVVHGETAQLAAMADILTQAGCKTFPTGGIFWRTVVRNTGQPTFISDDLRNAIRTGQVQ
jgi:hypothetical protein